MYKCKVCGDSFTEKRFHRILVCSDVCSKLFWAERSPFRDEYWVKKGFSIEEAKNKVSEIQRERSPRCAEYWVKKGFSIEEAKNKVSEIQRENSGVRIKKYTNLELREQSPRCVEYWIKKGFSVEEASAELSKFQQTTTLNRFISLYGDKEGVKRKKLHTKRSLYALSLDRYIKEFGEEEGVKRYGEMKSKSPVYYSKISQALFWSVYDRLSSSIKEKTYFAELNKEFGLRDGNRYYLYDFVISSLKLCIEFNGETFHPNKERLTLEEWKEWENPFTKEKADSVFEREVKKKYRMVGNGYKYLTIWESDYKANSSQTINYIMKEIMCLENEKLRV